MIWREKTRLSTMTKKAELEGERRRWGSMGSYNLAKEAVLAVKTGMFFVEALFLRVR
jgi:hypothetical protein